MVSYDNIQRGEGLSRRPSPLCNPLPLFLRFDFRTAFSGLRKLRLLTRRFFANFLFASEAPRWRFSYRLSVALCATVKGFFYHSIFTLVCGFCCNSLSNKHRSETEGRKILSPGLSPLIKMCPQAERASKVMLASRAESPKALDSEIPLLALVSQNSPMT